MSRLYFNSPSSTAELRGAEFHHLRSVAHSIAEPFWRISDLPDIADLLALVVPADGTLTGNTYLFEQLAKAQAEHAENTRLWAAKLPGVFPPTSYDQTRALRQSVKLALRSSSAPDLDIAGVRLGVAEIRLNTALRLGNDVVKLVVKIAGWGESHAWFDGKDRAWAADLIDQGLKSGVLRDGIWYVDGPSGDVLPKDHPQRKWSDMGWGEVTAFLRERDDEPVVLSYSVGDDFPNWAVADWTPPPMPEGWAPDWAASDEGRAEWESEHPEAADRLAYYDSQSGDQWYALPERERWDLAMAGLQERSPWLRLGPDTLDYWTFGPGVTVFDLYAADRDERVRRADAEEEAER
jgi:hypothetical protein